MGIIPIVKFEPNTHHLFIDLPILFINNWNEITHDFLKYKYNEFMNKNDWNMNKLKIDYWLNLINLNI